MVNMQFRLTNSTMVHYGNTIIVNHGKPWW